MEEGLGLQVEFESFPDVELAFESLAREQSGIELLNVRHEEDRTQATVFVPDGKLEHFEGLIRDYLAEKRNSRGHARDNRRLIDAIRQIRAASVRALWTDDPDEFPARDEAAVWWEVWLPVRRDRQAVVSAFRERAEAQEMRVAPGDLVFPERTVLLIHASAEQMQRSMLTLNSIAELRRAKETAEFFDSLPPEEQSEWLEELSTRMRYPASVGETPHVCLLDTGVNRRPSADCAGARDRRSTHRRARMGHRRRRRTWDSDGRAGPHGESSRTTGRQRPRGARSSPGIREAVAVGWSHRSGPPAPRIPDGRGGSATRGHRPAPAEGLWFGRHGTRQSRSGAAVGVVRDTGRAGGGRRWFGRQPSPADRVRR